MGALVLVAAERNAKAVRNKAQKQYGTRCRSSMRGYRQAAWLIAVQLD